MIDYQTDYLIVDADILTYFVEQHQPNHFWSTWMLFYENFRVLAYNEKYDNVKFYDKGIFGRAMSSSVYKNSHFKPNEKLKVPYNFLAVSHQKMDFFKTNFAKDDQFHILFDELEIETIVLNSKKSTFNNIRMYVRNENIEGNKWSLKIDTNSYSDYYRQLDEHYGEQDEKN